MPSADVAGIGDRPSLKATGSVLRGRGHAALCSSDKDSADSADCRQFLPDEVYSTDSIHGGGERRAGRGGIFVKTPTITVGERPMSAAIPQGTARESLQIERGLPRRGNGWRADGQPEARQDRFDHLGWAIGRG